MTDERGRDDNRRDVFPIVALCASAGGLESLKAFFETLPTGSGLAFIVVQHQHEQQESILSSIIQRDTSIEVVTIDDEMHIQPDCIYVLPSGYDVTVWNGQFQMSTLQRSTGWPDTIDRFLESLADDRGERVAAIILSGVGTDGTEGARRVKAAGGLVIAQDPQSALQDGMPDSVIQAGLADAVLLPSNMPDYLVDVLDRKPKPVISSTSLAETISEDDLQQIIRQLRRQSGRDFADYKTSTMGRQIARRMSSTQMNTVSDYLAFMQQHPEEADHLARYLLINVTNFFRDPKAFESLKENALLPTLRSLIDSDEVFRAWVPGCATGEEAFSLAILVHECLRELDIPDMEVRIFASDANRDLLQHGRSGLYPLSIADHVSEARLRDHFVEEEGGYRVRHHIRRMIIWSEQNLVEHPPFSQLHLISCRNVLIYFQKRLQNRVFALFQFALREGGILFLGSSETMPFSVDEFATIDSKHRIYRRVSGVSRSSMQFDEPLFKKLPDLSETPTPAPPSSRSDGSHELELTRNMLIDHYNPTSMIIDERYQVRYTYGEIDRYLRFATGVHTQRSVLELARNGLDVDLTIALHDSFTRDDETIVRENVWVKTNGHERIVNLVVKPVPDSQPETRLKMVIFELVREGQDLRSPDVTVEADTGDDADNSTNARLRKELRQTQAVLQSTTQALQAKSEELTSSMEEIRSANEEVQTTNEELRTSKEELESMNEELNTLNTQLTDQNHELTRARNTLHNFLQSTAIGMVFLDDDLTIREYTSAVTDIFGLRRGDVGRPLSEIAVYIEEQDLIADAKQVLDTLESIEKEVKTTDDRWYDVRIRPYRTTSNMIDGLVLTFSDITSQKVIESYLRDLIDTIENGLIELDGNLRVINANQSFYEMFEVNDDETTGRLLYDLGNGQWNIPDLRHLLTEIIPEQAIVRDYEVTHEFPDLGVRTMRLNARQIDNLDRILLVITNVSG